MAVVVGVEVDRPPCQAAFPAVARPVAVHVRVESAGDRPVQHGKGDVVGQPVGIGDGEFHRVWPRPGERMSDGHAAAVRPVAEVPGVAGQRLARQAGRGRAGVKGHLTARRRRASESCHRDIIHQKPAGANDAQLAGVVASDVAEQQMAVGRNLERLAHHSLRCRVLRPNRTARIELKDAVPRCRVDRTAWERGDGDAVGRAAEGPDGLGVGVHVGHADAVDAAVHRVHPPGRLIDEEVLAVGLSLGRVSVQLSGWVGPTDVVGIDVAVAPGAAAVLADVQPGAGGVDAQQRIEVLRGQGGQHGAGPVVQLIDGAHPGVDARPRGEQVVVDPHRQIVHCVAHRKEAGGG
jgi:hypothetical protein